MNNEKDRFGELMRRIERAKESVYFAQKDRELIERLKAELAKVESDREKTRECPRELGNSSGLES
jgi:hypothetical protein